MSTTLSRRLQNFSEADNLSCLGRIRHGIEKEGLRVTPDARLSQKPHPRALGSTLTHPSITTDYSEALLEFITPAYPQIEDALDDLTELHTAALKGMAEDEVVWAASMPPLLEGDDNIPVAEYGSSNIGQMKYVYRLGLAHRYGKAMQTIAGIHYNFSVDESFWAKLQELEGDTSSAMDFQSAGYFSLIRNFRRYSWLLSYLFGASPAADVSFLEKDNHGLQKLDDETWYLPWATSLRMSDLGYSNNAQSSLQICYNTLDNYVESLWGAIRTPYAPYKEIGSGPNGELLQLSSNVLQIENEFYNAIRPKRVMNSGEKPVVALRERGVEYIEVRNLDINPLMPLGIDDQQSRFLDVFLLFCALTESADIGEKECADIAENFSLSVREGRKPGLLLQDGERSIALTDWATEMFEQMTAVAALLDKAHGATVYSDSLNIEAEKIQDVSLTPSAKVLDVLSKGKSFRQYALELSEQHAEYFRNLPFSEERQEYYRKLAEQSLLDQHTKEETDDVDFATFLKQYFAEG